MAQHCRMPKRFCVFGAGTVQANGVYVAREGEDFEGCPIYENLGGYTLTVTRSPEDDEHGRMSWGWVIGRVNMAVYGCPTDEKATIPSGGWQCFKGEAPVPGEVVPVGESQDDAAAAYAREVNSGAFKVDMKRALSTFDHALDGGPALTADWARRAELLAGRAKVRQALDQFDQALQDIDDALYFKPDMLPALLLRARLLSETGELSDAALSAKQCWVILEDRAATGGGRESQKMLEKLRDDCKRMLEEVGERPDTLLPKGYEGNTLSPDDPDQEESAHPQVERTIGVQVSGAGAEDVNGVYRPTGEHSNGEPIYSNVRGFKLSLEVLPMKSTKEAKYGWVIGRDKVGFYGARTDKQTRRPPREGWRSFASGRPPVPTCLVKSVFADTLAAEGKDALCSRDAKAAIAKLTKALAQQRVAGDMPQRAAVLADLAAALREDQQLEAARMRAEEAVRVAPGSEAVHLEYASVLEALGDVDGAAQALQRLLTMRPANEQAAAQLLEIAASVPKARDWLRFHREIDASGLGDRVLSRSEILEERRRETERKLRQLARRRGPELFEDQEGEVMAQWLLPEGVAVHEIHVEIRVQQLILSIRGITIFDYPLLCPIKPSESYWNYNAPELVFMLCKSMQDDPWMQLRLPSKEEQASRHGALEALQQRTVGIV